MIPCSLATLTAMPMSRAFEHILAGPPLEWATAALPAELHAKVMQALSG